ncbi:MAG: hypothetical protein OXD39_02590, partial [Gemmatimonadetes bacterium]|nr:hypothetical protein [Gemmatimonadota bacterium]
MTEYMMAIIQAISTAGVLVVAALTFTRRFTKALREEMHADRDTLREEMRADREKLREEMHADRAAILGEIKTLR